VFSPANKYLSRLIEAYFQSPPRANAYLAPLVQKGAKNTIQISNARFISQYLHLPSNKAEQREVARCLSSLDELIAGERTKIEVLEARRSALMQQLFPFEGEVYPRLRFPEFCNDQTWQIESLDALYDFKPTNSYSREQLSYEVGEVKNIHYGDIHTKFSAIFDIRKECVPYVEPSQLTKSIKPEALCKEGDIVFADASEDLADVGKSIEIVNLNGEKLLAGSHTILARQKSDDFVLGFGGHLFQSRAVRAEIERVAQGTKVMGISPTRLAKLKVTFPRTKSEQRKIADCLTALDDLIAAQAHHVDALRIHKTGLMQQLFPTPAPAEGSEA
jgi:type I restriction enzyme, S subunit